MNVLLVAEDPISLEIAPAARIYHIGKALSSYGMKTTIMPTNKQLGKFLRGNSRIKKCLRRVYLFYQMLHIAKTKKIEFIILRSFYIGLEGILIAKILGAKSIFDFHGLVWKEEIHRGHRFKQFLTKPLEEMCIKKSDLIITQMESNRNAIKVLNDNVLVVKNGVDLSEFGDMDSLGNAFDRYQIPTNKPIIGFIGNWENWMNVEDLLKASQFLENVSIVIVGEGRKLQEYRNEYVTVFFTGRIPHMDAMQLLKKFDVCVSPYSEHEIMRCKSAFKTLEYMAAGKPIIVSNVFRKEDFLIEGESCLTYEPNNPEDLACKIKILIQNVDLRKKMGANNRLMVQNFTWEKNLSTSGLLEILSGAFR